MLLGFCRMHGLAGLYHYLGRNKLMTITRTKGEVVFECNTCGEVFGTGSEDFASTWEAAKDEGWIAVKKGKNWRHVCPEHTNS